MEVGYHMVQTQGYKSVTADLESKGGQEFFQNTDKSCQS